MCHCLMNVSYHIHKSTFLVSMVGPSTEIVWLPLTTLGTRSAVIPLILL